MSNQPNERVRYQGVDYSLIDSVSGLNPGAWAGARPLACGEGELVSTSPADGLPLGRVDRPGEAACEEAIRAAADAFAIWRTVPAPVRGRVVRRIGERLREEQDALGALISLEMGKIYSEGKGEVQSMIDTCDYAAGFSRDLFGLTMASERPGHRMMEQYQPLGPIGVISSFNFPAAVWAWNAMFAAVCGDTVVWKPASAVPLTAIAVQRIAGEVLQEFDMPEGVFTLVAGGPAAGDAIVEDPRIRLISFTGSTKVGHGVAKKASGRFCRTVLELGGNNAAIVTPAMDPAVAIPALVFGAVGTTGQRCTSTRRVIVHESIFEWVADAMVDAYGKLRAGHPFEQGVHYGPLVYESVCDDYRAAVQRAVDEGGKLLCGGDRLPELGPCYVAPAIVAATADMPCTQEELFGPLVYLIPYKGSVEDAIALQNDVRQGLASAIFTEDLHEVETFVSAVGSDCGIANVNLGTAGAEIGAAFGGEKESGFGRELGPEGWKTYMRRQTVTVNYSGKVAMPQGVQFKL